MKKEEREAVTLENHEQKIFGILHRPFIPNKYPAVLFCHGFGGNKSGKNRHYVELAQTLAENGCVVLRFDFRGAGDSEGKPEEMTISGETSDAQIALKYLSSHPYVDPSKIGIMGRSLGAVIAIKAASTQPNIKSLCLWSPLFDVSPWKKILENYQKTESPEFTINGLIPQKPFLKEFFQLNLEKELSNLSNIPLLHIHGKRDQTIAYEQTRFYKDLRKDAKASSHFISLEQSDHDFTILKEREYAIRETCQWFKQTL